MTGTPTTEQNRRIDANQDTATAVTFTTWSNETRHRVRFRHRTDQRGLWLVHEVDEDDGWRIVGRVAVKSLRVGSGELRPDHAARPLIQ